jgi:hypothetical protein
MTRQYPLEALRKLRDEQAKLHARNLAAQLTRCRAAEAVLQAKEQACAEHARQLSRTKAEERERLTRGELSGSDLLRATEFELACHAQAEQLELAVSEARRALAAERERERELRDVLTRSDADAKLVHKHQASFNERHAEQATRAEEEAALEQWNARRH